MVLNRSHCLKYFIFIPRKPQVPHSVPLCGLLLFSLSLSGLLCVFHFICGVEASPIACATAVDMNKYGKVKLNGMPTTYDDYDNFENNTNEWWNERVNNMKTEYSDDHKMNRKSNHKTGNARMQDKTRTK